MDGEQAPLLTNTGEDTMHCLLHTANTLNCDVCRADNNQGGAAGANPAVVDNNNNNSESLPLSALRMLEHLHGLCADVPREALVRSHAGKQMHQLLLLESSF